MFYDMCDTELFLLYTSYTVELLLLLVYYYYNAIVSSIPYKAEIFFI